MFNSNISFVVFTGIEPIDGVFYAHFFKRKEKKHGNTLSVDVRLTRVVARRHSEYLAASSVAQGVAQGGQVLGVGKLVCSG